MFIGLLAVPGLAYRFLRANSVLASWTAYILTRPLGASFADYLGFSHGAGGVGLVHPAVAVIFPVPIVVLVAYLAATTVMPRLLRPKFSWPGGPAPLTGQTLHRPPGRQPAALRRPW